MIEDRIPYYVVVKGNAYWRPTKRMRQMGFAIVRCGPDGDEARSIARTCAERWAAFRRSDRRLAEPQALSMTGYIYFLRVADRIKIGFSSAPLHRVADLSTALAAPAASIVAVRGTRADEKRLHARFQSYRSKGEWFVAARPIELSLMRSAVAGEVVHDGVERPNAEQKYQLVDTAPA